MPRFKCQNTSKALNVNPQNKSQNFLLGLNVRIRKVFAKNTVFGHFDKWPTLDFRKWIRNPTPGHPIFWSLMTIYCFLVFFQNWKSVSKIYPEFSAPKYSRAVFGQKLLIFKKTRQTFRCFVVYIDISLSASQIKCAQTGCTGLDFFDVPDQNRNFENFLQKLWFSKKNCIF